MFTQDLCIWYQLKILEVGEELAANYNLYTYPKTGVGFQSY